MVVDFALPPIKLYYLQLGHEKAWSDQYGAIQAAAKYCDINVPINFFPGVWQHGCFGPWLREIPDAYVYHAPNGKSSPAFVARIDEEEVLRGSGYNHALAIGLPFVYLPEIHLRPRKNTLLVVPVHSMVGLPFDTKIEMEEYANYIASISSEFQQVIVCVHPGCIHNRHWIEQFEARGIKWIVGAINNDENALLRVKMLFSQFEYITTNGWGSHVAYALSIGAKVSIHGAMPKFEISSLVKDEGMGGDIQIVNKYFSESAISEERKYLNKFYVAPLDGICDKELGDWFIGLENKKSREELISLFGWSLKNRIYHQLKPSQIIKTIELSLRKNLRPLKHVALNS